MQNFFILKDNNAYFTKKILELIKEVIYIEDILPLIYDEKKLQGIKTNLKK